MDSCSPGHMGNPSWASSSAGWSTSPRLSVPNRANAVSQASGSARRHRPRHPGREIAAVAGEVVV